MPDAFYTAPDNVFGRSLSGVGCTKRSFRHLDKQETIGHRRLARAREYVASNFWKRIANTSC